MIRTVLFDLDGTLADTAPDLATAVNRLRQEEGRAPLDEAILRPWTSGGVPALLKAGGVDTAIDPVALNHYMSFHSVVPPERTILKGVKKLPPGCVATLGTDGRRTMPRARVDAVHSRSVAGEWPNGKAPDSGSGDSRFESLLASQLHRECGAPPRTASTVARVGGAAGEQQDPLRGPGHPRAKRLHP